MADRRKYQQTETCEPFELEQLRSTSLLFGPHSPYLARKKLDIRKFYRHLFFPNQL